MKEHTYNREFEYTHDNPYHNKFGKFSNYILRDKEGEDLKGLWNKKLFKRDAPLFLEIGSGYGHFMMEFCEENPDINFVGLDYRFKRSYNLAKKLSASTFNNYAYLRAKGERACFLFEKNELDKIFYFFPDPWPKNKHRKKRLFQPHFLDHAYEVLRPGGEFLIKTDHDEYAEWMKKVIDGHSHKFSILLESKDLRTEYPDNFLTQHKTKFEKIFIAKNQKIKAFILKSKKE